MNPAAEFDVIVYGATGYTGRLVAEHLARRYGVGGEVKWAMAGRSQAKLAQVRDEIGAPADTPLIVADAADPASLDAMVRRTKAVITTVGPYQLYGDQLIAACAAAGTDYLDLTGEPNWMARTIAAHHETAQKTGARLCHSCGFDSIPFELGVWFCEQTAKERLGAPAPRVKGRVRAIKGGLSGGTAASGAATMAAIQKDPSQLAVMMNPFALTPGFEGPAQPPGNAKAHDDDIGAEVGPFMMAVINTKNVHRSNFLMGHPYGRDFQYDEMAIVAPGSDTEFTQLGDAGPKPGEGPSKEERESGFFDLLFVGVAADGRKVRVSVKGEKDPGYGSTSMMIAESAICLVKECPDVAGGVWTPGAAMQERLVRRLEANAAFTFTVED
ncbi:saccharopine dehydrogenase family protein [Phenylobacterium sp.]|jgi:short subunit dehydrogenase-like uncharacterized protein|uniref:saccharopine dehydrogenase family protein n=1 Tax=Phenylobacterium sp. TaxID=1871053 RepID=UPI002F92F639